MRLPSKEQSFVDDVMFGRATEDDMKLEVPRISQDYGDNWEEMQRRVKTRDNYRCRVCGKHERYAERDLDVHHIQPLKTFSSWKEANKLSNLILLCRRHHGEYEERDDILRSLLS